MVNVSPSTQDFEKRDPESPIPLNTGILRGSLKGSLKGSIRVLKGIYKGSIRELRNMA